MFQSAFCINWFASYYESIFYQLLMDIRLPAVQLHVHLETPQVWDTEFMEGCLIKKCLP